MTDSTRMTGCVKWFNSKTGYGFITVSDETSRDIFVHYSNVKVNGLQYTYLVQGEYVEFDLAETEGENTKHTHQAVNITGIRGGPIMCETRYLNHMNQSSAEEESSERKPRPVSSVQRPRVPRAPRASTGGAKFEEEEGYTKVVRKNRPAPKK